MRRLLSTLLSLLILVALALDTAQAQVPTSNVLYRVLRIKTPTQTGSAPLLLHLLTSFWPRGDGDGSR